MKYLILFFACLATLCMAATKWKKLEIDAIFDTEDADSLGGDIDTNGDGVTGLSNYEKRDHRRTTRKLKRMGRLL